MKPCNDCKNYGRCNLQHREDTSFWERCDWFKKNKDYQKTHSDEKHDNKM